MGQIYAQVTTENATNQIVWLQLGASEITLPFSSNAAVNINAGTYEIGWKLLGAESTIQINIWQHTDNNWTCIGVVPKQTMPGGQEYLNNDQPHCPAGYYQCNAVVT